MERWIIKPQTAPSVLRSCSKCGGKSKFVLSGNFRMNANGKNIDVWLIYKCSKCDTTWNMEIMSRMKPHQIEKPLYQAFVENDLDTAMAYAFDTNVLNKNKAVVSFDDILYTVEKQMIEGLEYGLEIVSPYDIDLRLDKLLSDELGLSRTKVKVMLADGFITSDDITLSAKTKVKGTLRVKELGHQPLASDEVYCEEELLTQQIG